MNWSRNAPTAPGYYWVRRAYSDGQSSDAEVVMVDESKIVHYFREREIGQPTSAITWLSWYPGPIEPPAASTED